MAARQEQTTFRYGCKCEKLPPVTVPCYVPAKTLPVINVQLVPASCGGEPREAINFKISWHELKLKRSKWLNSNNGQQMRKGAKVLSINLNNLKLFLMLAFLYNSPKSESCWTSQVGLSVWPRAPRPWPQYPRVWVCSPCVVVRPLLRHRVMHGFRRPMLLATFAYNLIQPPFNMLIDIYININVCSRLFVPE